MGADLAYIGSPFLATTEANTQPAFKRMIVESTAADVIVTNCFTGVDASFLRPSLVENGLDPATLHRPAGAAVDIANGGANARAWRDIWSAGQGIGAITQAEPAGDYIDRLVRDYAAARVAMGMA
jgi:nitronate monooxygenase